MISPRRFGLKYAPIPTLALEYEENVTMNSDANTSYYVMDAKAHSTRRLHVMEIPAIDMESIERILQQLLRDNERFLSPNIVNHSQLHSLLTRLALNTPTPQAQAEAQAEEEAEGGAEAVAAHAKGESEAQAQAETKGEPERQAEAEAEAEVEEIEEIEEIESEELEYFSEDDSEEDSF
uniref:Uncharacterized protein AlNc14C513G12004 n=1 Tax=Albugo laibachii Nc14 TaxID=890382 RepID=F0X0R0_9STRA|nr:conserved hypothetical protein [Albugo laibachii Nc14]|eukprot:CCA27354.1 conserved hypothetical protein [Albugo laibachii Nc14]